MKLKRFLLTAGLVITLSGCTVPTDPFVSEVQEAVTDTSFEDTNQMASGCIGVYLYCAQPMYEPVFFVPETEPVEEVCSNFIAIAKELGVVAYAVSGSDAFGFPASGTDVLDLCTGGLGKPLINTDGSEFYQSPVLFDDGVKDGFGKVYSLTRGSSEFGDGYVLIISFSKDLNRVGHVIYGSEKPKLLTQSDLDSSNQANEVLSEAMQFAITLIGLPESQAIEKAEDAGYSWAVSDRDGVEQQIEQPGKPARIVFVINDGKVFDVQVG